MFNQIEFEEINSTILTQLALDSDYERLAEHEDYDDDDDDKKKKYKDDDEDDEVVVFRNNY